MAGMEVEAYSALAQVRSAQGCPAEAIGFSAHAIHLLQQGTPTEEPEGVYFVHAEILRETGERAAARGALEKAWTLLQQRASRLQREEYRRSFLENVPKHRQIQARRRSWD
jgi:hypothetical protein